MRRNSSRLMSGGGKTPRSLHITCTQPAPARAAGAAEGGRGVGAGDSLSASPPRRRSPAGIPCCGQSGYRLSPIMDSYDNVGGFGHFHLHRLPASSTTKRPKGHPLDGQGSSCPLTGATANRLPRPASGRIDETPMKTQHHGSGLRQNA